MSWSSSGTTLTQTGTDTDLSGLNGLTGVTTNDFGNYKQYAISATYNIVINGTLSMNQNAISAAGEQLYMNPGDYTVNWIKVAGTLTIGVDNASLISNAENGQIPAILQGGSIINDTSLGSSGTADGGTSSTTAKAMLWVASGGTLRIYGGQSLALVGCVTTHESATEITLKNCTIKSNHMYLFKVTTIDGLVYQRMRADGIAGNLAMVAPTGTTFTNFSHRGFSATSPWVGGSGSTPINATYSIVGVPSLPTGYIAGGGRADSFANRPYFNFYNSADGSGGNTAYELTASSPRYGEANIYQKWGTTVKDSSGTAIENALVRITGKSGQVYTATTNASGVITTQNILLKNFYRNDGGSPASATTYYCVSNNSTDDFAVRMYSYSHQLGLLPTQIMKSQTTMEVPWTLFSDSYVTSSKATIDAMTSYDDWDDVYDAAKSWKVASANCTYPTTDTLLGTAAGTLIDFGSQNIVFNASAASAFAVNTGTNTITIKPGTNGIIQGTKFVGFTTTGTVTLQNGAYIKQDSGAIWEASGSTYYASSVSHTVSVGGTPISGAEVAYFDSGSTNRTYNTSRAAVTSLTSNGSGVVSGFVVWKVNSTTYTGHTVVSRQYGYQLYSAAQTISGATVSTTLAMVADSFAATAEGTVAAYTGISLNYGTKVVTVSAAHTLTKVYEYMMYSVTLQANIAQAQPISTVNGTTYTLATDWDVVVTGATLAEIAKRIDYQGTGALTVSSSGRFEDSTGLVFESGGSTYYGKHVYRNVKDSATSTNQQYAVVACWDTDADIDVTYNTSLTNGGLTTDSSGNVEGYYIYKKDSTTYTLVEHIGLYAFGWSTVPIASNGTAVGSSGSYDTIRLAADPYVTLSRVNALAVSGVTVNHSTAVIDGNANTYSQIQDNLKARQARTDDIESGKKGYVSYYQEGHLISYDGSFYTLSAGWIIEDTTFGGTLKDSILRLSTAGTYNILLNSSQVNFEGNGTYDLRGATITTDITVDTITNATVTVQFSPGTTVTNNDPTNITVQSSTSVTITVNNVVAGSRIQIYDTDNTTELFNEIVAGTTFSDNFTYTTDTDIRIRLMLVGASTARKWWTTTGTITSSGFSVNAAQEVNSVYATNGVDGSTVTECAINANNIDIQVDDPNNETTAQRIYNWYQYYLFSEDGIRNSDSLITATDSTHYVFDNSVEIKNMDTVNPLNILGANIVPTSGSATDVFDLSNGASIAVNFERVEGFAYSSGSGLSAGQAAQLDAIEAKTANIVDNLDVATKNDVIAASQM